MILVKPDFKIKALLFAVLLGLTHTLNAQMLTLANAFAHNDYRHKRPLAEAQAHGYTHIEADVFLFAGKLVVAHVNPFFKGKRTLENLYLAPLARQVALNQGAVYEGYDEPVTLMIDIKTGGKRTYAALKPLLEKYRDILSSYDSGQVTKRAITIVLSGRKPYKEIKNEKSRLAFIDEDLRKVERDTMAYVSTMASCKYSKLLKWKGEGEMPDDQKARLQSYVDKAHSKGHMVRLWGMPQNQTVWRELLNCGVDLINTDKLAALKDFLLNHNNR